MNKMLVLGSDYGTLELVRKAKARGMYVYATDLMTTSPTKQAADEAWMISTTDLDTLEAKCRELGINAVITGASDFNIERSRELCARLGLPVYCQSDRAWEVATNKREFKDLCRKLGAPVAEDYTLTDDFRREDLANIKYPVVVKPVDKSGNRGMSYCANEQELIAAYKYARQVSDNATIIVERELHGPEFAVNYIMTDGKIQLYFFSSEHNEPGELENLYSVINTTSEHLKQYLEEVNDKVIDVFREAGLREGVAWVECIRDTDGRFYLLEMGYRLGGEVINVSYDKGSGFDSMDFLVDIACGVKHKAEDLPAPLTDAEIPCAAAYLLFARRDAVIGSISGLEELERMEGVYPDFPKREGGAVRFHATMGVIRIVAENMDDLCGKIAAINSVLSIQDTDGNDMFIKYTDFDTLQREYRNGLREFGK